VVKLLIFYNIYSLFNILYIHLLDSMLISLCLFPEGQERRERLSTPWTDSPRNASVSGVLLYIHVALMCVRYAAFT